MSHGCKHNLLAAKDGKYSLDADIMTPILKNKSLTSKLKFLAVQAYKGPEHHKLSIDGQEDEPTAIPSEILQVTSSFDGDASNMETGPPNVPIFIKTLCEQLESCGLTKNILDISNALVAEVEKNYKGVPIPMIHTNLTKKFVFGHFIPSDSNIDVNNLEDEDDTSSEEEDLITF